MTGKTYPISPRSAIAQGPTASASGCTPPTNVKGSRPSPRQGLRQAERPDALPGTEIV